MITIAPQLMKNITQAAKQAYPNECCGLLAGTRNINGAVTITQARNSANVAKSSIKKHFQIDPIVHFDLIHELEGTGEQIIGHYHSHPNHPARPSEKDLKMAFEKCWWGPIEFPNHASSDMLTIILVFLSATWLSFGKIIS